MTHDEIQPQLSEFFDGGRSTEVRREIDSHLGICPDCRAVLNEYEAIRRLVRAPVVQAPAHDPWARILRRLEPRRSWLGPPRVRLAWAATIALLLAGATYRTILRPGSDSHQTRGGYATSEQSVSLDATPADDTSYAARIEELEQLLSAGSDRMDPTTLQVAEESLRAIDEALDRVAEALEADPENRLLRALLTRSRGQKLGLMEDLARSL